MRKTYLEKLLLQWYKPTKRGALARWLLENDKKNKGKRA